jgi:hypothetical protein
MRRHRATAVLLLLTSTSVAIAIVVVSRCTIAIVVDFVACHVILNVTVMLI